MPTTVSKLATPAPETPTAAKPAVSLRGVSKTFRLPHEQYSTLKQRVLHPRRSRTFSELHALRDVSFEVAPGEFFGIVGRNGSGKSTLLKCLAGIYGADSGTIAVDGRLSPFIELGVGFHPELTARDNVAINAIMLGLSRKQALERFDEILAFAELEEFVDLKLKNYSSGMTVRLGFAVAIQVDAEILLVDEVLAVGDIAFQQKCFDEFERMKADGRTIVFVTHDMGAVRRFCDRALLIERGDVLDIGDPETISAKYEEVNFGGLGDEAAVSRATGVPRVRVLRTWCEDETGSEVAAVAQGARCSACMEVEFSEQVTDPVFAITFRNEVRHTIYIARSDVGGPAGAFEADQRATVRFAFPNWLSASTYTMSPSVLGSDFRVVLDQQIDTATLAVESERFTGGVAELPTEVEVERS